MPALTEPNKNSRRCMAEETGAGADNSFILDFLSFQVVEGLIEIIESLDAQTLKALKGYTLHVHNRKRPTK
jgi:hypothetical protein